LIELLRGRHYVDVAQEQAGAPREPVVDAGTGQEGSLAPARGIVVGVLLSAVIWAALALAVWALTRHWASARHRKEAARNAEQPWLGCPIPYGRAIRDAADGQFL